MLKMNQLFGLQHRNRAPAVHFADFIGKVTAIFFRFQEKSWILLKLVWTNAPFMDKSRKKAKKLSKYTESLLP